MEENRRNQNSGYLRVRTRQMEDNLSLNICLYILAFKPQKAPFKIKNLEK